MTDSHLISKGPCDACKSSDACASYDDGHTFCFSCNAYGEGEGDGGVRETPRADGLLRCPVVALEARRITAETCKKFGYEAGEDESDNCVQVANYVGKDGSIVAQKLRYQGKKFLVRGDMKKALLFGQQLWRDGGKKVVVTEGEIDAMTVSQMQGNRWPVVSIPNGAAGAAAALTRHMDWLLKFDEIVLMFDMDEPGQAAAKECAALLPPGRVKIARLADKDPNALLQAGRGEEIIKAMWDAVTFRPDGILDSDEVLKRIENAPPLLPTALYPYPTLQTKTRGILPGQIHIVTGGSGTGKTEFWRSVVLHNLELDPTFKAGVISLEESVERAAVGLVGMRLKMRLDWVEHPHKIPKFYEAWNAIIKDRVFFYDHRGSMDLDNIEARIRYLHTANGCRVVVVDNLTVMSAQMDGDNERVLIDHAVARFAKIVQETNVSIILCCHLKRPPGTAHEEGGETSLSQLRGSGGIGHFAMVVVGLERNQQDPDTPNQLTFRILKNRNTGKTGMGGRALYDENCGTFEPISDAPEVKVTPLVPDAGPMKPGGF